jgi:uncharacterized membrane protein YidH (DUF202 family)
MQYFSNKGNAMDDFTKGAIFLICFALALLALGVWSALKIQEIESNQKTRSHMDHWRD